MQLGGISVGRNTDLHRPVAVRACHVVLDKGPVKIELFRQSELPDAANGYDKYIYIYSIVCICNNIYIYSIYSYIPCLGGLRQVSGGMQNAETHDAPSRTH